MIWKGTRFFMSVGCKARGDASEPAMRHEGDDAGQGRVAAHDGHYEPAIAAKRRVTVLVAEVTGAMSDSVVATVAHCEDMAGAAGGSDRTGYGISRTATTSFFTHHLRVLSSAVAWGVGEAVSRAARKSKRGSWRARYRTGCRSRIWWREMSMSRGESSR